MTDWPRGGRTRSRVADSAHSLIAALSAMTTGRASTEATSWRTGSSPVTAAIITVEATKQTRHRFPSRRPADCSAGLLVCLWENLSNLSLPPFLGLRNLPPLALKGPWILAGGFTLRYLHMSGTESLSQLDLVKQS